MNASGPRCGDGYWAARITLRAMRHLVLAALLMAAGCANGPAAPLIESSEVVCTDAFCLSVPQGWDVEKGEGYLAFRHDDAPDQAQATISPINMQAMVENAGDAWPAETADVVRAFWQLLEDADVARFEHLERLTGGAFRSEGKYESGKMWHLIIPGIGSDALAVEVRGPNASWVIHADVFFDDVVILE